MSRGIAQHLASYGRGGDTELVHMTKGEIKGLQDLALAHGGSLTVNPDTGLVEAGFLKQILPMVAGAALMATGVGAPMAALMVGGGMGLMTGSLKEGLIAGLGAYGGASMAGSLGALGAEATAAASQQAATEGFKTVANDAVTSGLQNLPVGSGGVGIPTETGMYFPGATPGAGTEVAGAAGTNYYQQAAQNYITPQNFPGLTPEQITSSQAGLPEAMRQGAAPEQYVGSLGRASATQAGTTTGNIAKGIGEVVSSPSAAGSFAKDNAMSLIGTAAPMLMSSQSGVGPAKYQEDEYDRRLARYKLSPNYQAYEAPQPNPYYKATYAAGGGLMDSNPMYDAQNNMAAGGLDSYNLASGGIARFAGRKGSQVNAIQDYLDRQKAEPDHLAESVGVPRTGIYRDTDVDTAKKDALTASMIRMGKSFKAAGLKPVSMAKMNIKGLGDVSGATPDDTEAAAAGGVMRSHLGGYSDGGRMLKGPGDGMSDSIPATISGKQPARLADGEFVVPADVVSHLGNGSTDAGAKRLYGMMDKIRKARTGKKKQAPQVKAGKYLPA